jgi:hypothetical protein
MAKRVVMRRCGVAALAVGVFLASPLASASATTATATGAASALVSSCDQTSNVTITFDDPSVAPIHTEGEASCSASTASGGVRPAASGDYGQNDFYPNSPFFAAADNNGRFYAQVTYSRASLPVAFGFYLSPYLQSIGAGLVNASVTESPSGCHYGDSAKPVDYTFHWSCPTHRANYRQLLGGSFVFRVNVAGRPGTAHVAMQFRYVIALTNP